jgi:uncharacterized membrane protein YeaQ/YmgE (transglycosylase-associated protein family)
MSLILWIILGWFVGLLANWIMGVKDRAALVIVWLISIAGALLSGFLASVFGLASLWSPDLRGLLIAVGGSVVLVAAYHAVKGGSDSTHQRTT